MKTVFAQFLLDKPWRFGEDCIRRSRMHRLCSLLLLLMSGGFAETLNDDLPVTTATYLGGSQDETVVGAAFGSAGDFFLAGNFTSDYLPQGAVLIPIDGQGQGALVRLSKDGQEALSLTRFDENVQAFAASSFGFAVALEQSILVLSSSGDALQFGAISFAAKRVDIAVDGHLVALSEQNEIRVYSPQGVLQAQQTFNQFTRVDDVAITPTGRIVFTGYNQLNANLKSPFLECYEADLETLVWQAYGFSNTEVTGQNLGADSEGERVAIGADGLLYFSGATDGGNTVFQRRPDAITTTLNSGTPPGNPILETTDVYNQPVSLSGSAKFSFHARFDPETGQIQKAQFLLARLSSGNQNTIRIREITADAVGNVLIVGRAFADIEGRDRRSVGGQAVGGYAGGNMFALAVESAYRNRLYWTSFNGNAPGQSEGFAVATQGDITNITGAYAFSGDVFAEANSDSMIISNGVQIAPGGGREAYLAIKGNTFQTLYSSWPNEVDIRDLVALVVN
jgi:hypothetical protein